MHKPQSVFSYAVLTLVQEIFFIFFSRGGADSQIKSAPSDEPRLLQLLGETPQGMGQPHALSLRVHLSHPMGLLRQTGWS